MSGMGLDMDSNPILYLWRCAGCGALFGSPEKTRGRVDKFHADAQCGHRIDPVGFTETREDPEPGGTTVAYEWMGPSGMPE